MKWYYWLIIAFVLFVFIKGKSMFDTLTSIFKRWEGFSPVPYWDNKQWSWGYGTEVPDSIANPSIKPAGTISQQQAINDALSHSAADKQYLQGKLTRQLNNNQWAALLSFAYNLGSPTAAKLIPEINSNAKTLESHWKQYVYAGGKINNNLVARRNYEWTLFNSL